SSSGMKSARRPGSKARVVRSLRSSSARNDCNLIAMRLKIAVAGVAVASLVLFGHAGAQSAGGRLFYLDIGSGGRVLSANTDGSGVVVLSKSRAAGPDGIVVDPGGKHLFWTTMGAVSANDGTIERAGLDGA